MTTHLITSNDLYLKSWDSLLKMASSKLEDLSKEPPTRTNSDHTYSHSVQRPSWDLKSSIQMLEILYSFAFNINGEMYKGKRTLELEQTASAVLDHFTSPEVNFSFQKFLTEQKELAIGILKIMEYWIPRGERMSGELDYIGSQIRTHYKVRCVLSVERWVMEVDLKSNPRKIKEWFGCDPRVEDPCDISDNDDDDEDGSLSTIEEEDEEEDEEEEE